MHVRLEVPRHGGWILHDLERVGYSLIVQLDYQAPWLADNLGCTECICNCGYTDGTIDCDHMTASSMIERATEWLFEHDGEEFSALGLDECWEYFERA